MKILIAVDKSNEAEEAFDFLLNIVSKADHVYIASLTSGLPVSCSLPAPMVDAAWAEIEKQVSALLEHFAERLIKQNIQTTCLHGTSNDVGYHLCKLVKKLNIDLLVIGRCSSPLGRVLAGSISNYCSHHSKCSILVVPEKLQHTNHIC